MLDRLVPQSLAWQHMLGCQANMDSDIMGHVVINTITLQLYLK